MEGWTMVFRKDKPLPRNTSLMTVPASPAHSFLHTRTYSVSFLPCFSDTGTLDCSQVLAESRFAIKVIVFVIMVCLKYLLT